MGHIRVVKYLIDQGANPKTIDHSERSVLDLAHASVHLEDRIENRNAILKMIQGYIPMYPPARSHYGPYKIPPPWHRGI